MLCRRCDARFGVETMERARGAHAGRWSGSGVRTLLCPGCGTILASADIVRRLLEKQSQLAQFGLAGAAPPLLEPLRGKSD